MQGSLFPEELPIYKVNDLFIELPVVIKPGAFKNQILGIVSGRLKVAINELPIDGKANKALIKFLASSLNISKSQVEIIKGLTNSNKVIRLPRNLELNLISLLKNNS